MQKIGVFWLKKIHQSWFVVWFAVGVVAGIVLGIMFRINYFASGWFIMLSGFLFIICLVRPLLICSVLAVLAGFLVSFVRVTEELTGENFIRQFYGTRVMMVGEVSGDPEIDESQTKIKLTNLRFGEKCGKTVAENDDECFVTRGNVYVTLSRNEKIRWGDTVMLDGEMSEGFGTYAGYMYKPRVVWWARPEPGSWILKLRDWFAERIERAVGGETESKLGLSYLMGMKAGLPEGLEENLRTVGLTHIVVASGAHLAILVEVAKKLFGRISRFAGLLFSVIFIVMFMALVGWTPSILRAGVMAILTLVSWYVGRKMQPWRMILLVAAGTLLINPMFVMNMGWMLSFASYAGIMVVGPRLTKFFYEDRKPGFLGSTILTTVSATIMTLPIVLYYYGQMSLISVVANLLILPTLPFAMGMTFLTGVVAGVPLVEFVAGWMARTMLNFHILVVEFFGQMRQFLVTIEPYQMWVFGIYVVVAGILMVAILREAEWTKRVKSGKIKISN